MARRRGNSATDRGRSGGRPTRLSWSILTLGGALAAYVAFNMATGLNAPVRQATAEATVWLFNLLGGNASLNNTIISAQNARFIVVNDCTPVGVVLLAGGAVLASPVTLSWKAIGLAATAFGLVALNFLRLVSLVFLGTVAPEQLDTVHLLVWQPVMVLAAIAAWFLWYLRAERALRQASAS